MIYLHLIPENWPIRLAGGIRKYEECLARIGAAFSGVPWQSKADFSRRKRQDIQVQLVSDAAMAKLNKKYRGMSGATDVLSFAYGESGAPVFAHEPVGEVYIALGTAARQGRLYGQTLSEELCTLTVHGVLHVMGYDHEKDTDAGKMRRAEAKVLKKTGTAASAGLIGR